jgi:hypothetical protein
MGIVLRQIVQDQQLKNIIDLDWYQLRSIWIVSGTVLNSAN